MSTSATEPAASTRWATRAFGLELTGDFPVVGLDTGGDAPPPPDGAPGVALERGDRAALTAAWPHSGVQRISDVRDPAGRRAMTIERHATAGHLLTGVGYGRFHVDAPAERVRCAPVPTRDQRWQRYLLGQVLPFVAGLRGRELLHAGAVVIDDHAVVVSGPSGAGKTTLVAHLVAAGAGFLADDTVALEARGDAVLAHPGPAVAFLRPDAARLLTPDAGEVVAASEQEVSLEMLRAPAPVPLGAIAFLVRGAHGPPRVDRLAPEDPRPLLAATYDVVRRDAARVSAQLDLLARVAQAAVLLRVVVPQDASPSATAEALADAARSCIRGAQKASAGA